MRSSPPYEKRLKRNGYRTISDAKDPFDGETWDLLVSNKKIEAAPKLGKEYTPTLAHCVTNVIGEPVAIYKGLKRDEGEENGFCYVGLPARKYPGGKPHRAPVGEAFFVFVSEDRVIYEWGWEACRQSSLISLAETSSPRFCERLYP